MDYRIRFERTTRKEIDDTCEVYGYAFRSEIESLFESIVSAAGESAQTKRNSLPDDFDVSGLFEMASAVSESPHDWMRTVTKWWNASITDKLRVILHIVTTRTPPWQLRCARRRIEVIGTFTCEVIIFYELDHIGKQVVIRLVHGLPGQE